MKYIWLSNGYKVKVDDKYAYLQFHYNWHYRKNSKDKTGYARAEIGKRRIGVKRRHIYLHNLIADLEGLKLPIDHKDRDGLNCLISNFRTCTASQNIANQDLRINSSTGIKGVNWNKDRQLYIVRVMKEGVSHYVGAFNCPIEAAIAYNRKALELFGEFAWLNDIEELSKIYKKETKEKEAILV